MSPGPLATVLAATLTLAGCATDRDPDPLTPSPQPSPVTTSPDGGIS